MGGNDLSYADYIEKEMEGKEELTKFVPWYVRRVSLMHILEKRGYEVTDNGGPLLIRRTQICS